MVPSKYGDFFPSFCFGIEENKNHVNTSREKEHLRNLKTAAKRSRIANHACLHVRAIDFENASIIDSGRH